MEPMGVLNMKDMVTVTLTGLVLVVVGTEEEEVTAIVALDRMQQGILIGGMLEGMVRVTQPHLDHLPFRRRNRQNLLHLGGPK